MICFFFINEEVINYETAKTSKLELLTNYYKLMADEEIYHPPSQFERLFLSAAYTKEDIKKTVEAFHKLFAQLER